MYHRYDVCESKVEVTTPYWASNSNGKVRAILNNEQFEQAIHQEICRYVSKTETYRVTTTCSQPATLRCNHDCSCQQKYKWHRLLAYDPNNDCAGVFMDWFLFPSCCTCRQAHTGCPRIKFTSCTQFYKEYKEQRYLCLWIRDNIFERFLKNSILNLFSSPQHPIPGSFFVHREKEDYF